MKPMKNFYIIILSLLIACMSAYLANGADALENLRFHISSALKEREREDIREAVRQYNTNSASFYSSAGFLAGLEEIPAAPLLKRMLFKDITMLKGQNLVMIFDKDTVEFDEVRFVSRLIAVAHTHEVWGVVLQKTDTRRPVSTVKGVEVNVRYFMYKGSLRGEEPRWIVFEVAVYPKDEEVPELNIKPVL
jgi:hypothetical protein